MELSLQKCAKLSEYSLYEGYLNNDLDMTLVLILKFEEEGTTFDDLKNKFPSVYEEHRKRAITNTIHRYVYQKRPSTKLSFKNRKSKTKLPKQEKRTASNATTKKTPTPMEDPFDMNDVDEDKI